LQKIVMLGLADIVVVNKTDQARARAAISEIERRLDQNMRAQRLVASVAKRHRDSGVDELFGLISGNAVAAVSDNRDQNSRRSESAATKRRKT
jgi:putative protein kinase ArgK-like GTPase of G3E family